MQHLNNNWTIEGLPRCIVKLIDSIQGEQKEGKGGEAGVEASQIVYIVLAAIIIAKESMEKNAQKIIDCIQGEQYKER